MADPYLGEIRMVGFNFAPRGWAFCDGQALSIAQHSALYALLGTTYGGDGRTSFALPDLRGRAPIHKGEGHALGRAGGEEAHALAVAELPTHGHTFGASATGDEVTPADNFIGNAGANYYTDPSNLVAMATGAIANVGGGQAHENMQPFLAVRFCIALQGVFPSRP